jgi:thioredoxin-like negative regulator of GroEL
MRASSRRIGWLPLASLIGLLLSTETCLGVPFVKDAKKVLSGQLERPAVVVFGATWCGWCRKMDTVTLTHEAVESIADDFIWVQIDIDEQEELAAQYGVRGVPETIVLNKHGAIIGNVSGYVPPERFVDFLQETLASPQADVVPLPRALEQFLASEDDEEQLLQIITTLARPDRHGRPLILEAFEQKGPSVADDLVGLLSHEHLGIRAAAAHALRHATGANLPFNAFAAPEKRGLQTQAWLDWLKENQS